MSIYHINFIENKPTKAGLMKAEAQVTDESGVMTDKVTLWASNWPNFNDLKPGSEVRAELQVKQNGQYTNKTLYPERTQTLNKPKQAPAWAVQKDNGAVKAAKITSESVSEAQTRKEQAIVKAGAMRDATLLTVALINAYAQGKILNLDDVKKDWQEWKKWLESEANDEGVPF